MDVFPVSDSSLLPAVLTKSGPLTKDVTDAALLLNIISGYDPMDSTSINEPVPDYTKSLTGDVRGLSKSVFPKNFLLKGSTQRSGKPLKQLLKF
jgi:aspartyl-tRNA(Asn)/glutamyl-tRNA(Gln) amidotransferase subunit A